MNKTFKLHGTDLEVKIGGYADQADGAAWLICGKNVLLSTVVAAKETSDVSGFMPLTVEFRKRPSAAGKFPSGFIKREGRLSDKEILASRVIDRSIRPFFPEDFSNEVQVLSTLLSSDGTFPSVIMGVLASSIAVMISGIPFLGPVGAVQICKKDGKWVVNPNFEVSKDSRDNILVAGNKDGICMVEGRCTQISEEELMDVLDLAFESIKPQLAWQEEIVEALKVESNLGSQNDLSLWKEKVRAAMPKDWDTILFAGDKAAFSKNMNEAKSLVMSKFESEVNSGAVSKGLLDLVYDLEVKRIIPDVIIGAGKRFDGRSFDQIRQISGVIGLLPCTHGSASFRRGQTHALASISLGTASDAQKEDSLFEGTIERTFMLHYNFPPFATGEVKQLRGVGRREIGHGYLAERAFADVLPDHEKFPYTIRSVVDILECYGSSSMATTCATTLALMDAGVPLKAMVAGIAMGLLKSSDGKYALLSDISGAEDFLGLMDFKVVGTDVGITAFQMDVKAKAGIPRNVTVEALSLARKGRIHILSEMKKVIDRPRSDLAETAPRVSFVKIATDKIGALIGPGGKNIKEIISQTGVQIDVQDDGNVRIYATDKDSASKAIGFVRALTGEVEIGYSCEGQIRGMTDFGIFVEVFPGKDGLVHVSSMSKENQNGFSKNLKIGDKIKVVVEAYDKVSGKIKLMAPSLK